ncbi:MAG: hypothetical protein GF418_15720 [Chitinivibrionales bacterium]|nr:hypothetical protein [Chitinivibrionales bacterium]MBD3397070.1 hypothetical protein [Chitinivibrionales bacterium]
MHRSARNIRRFLLSSGVACGLCVLAPAVSGQPLPTGPRLRDLADEAGISIGVRTFMINNEYNTIVEREFNAGTRTYYPRYDAAHVDADSYNFTAFNNGVNWLSGRGMQPMEHLLFGNDLYEPDWVIDITSASALDSLMRKRIAGIMQVNDNASKVHVWNVVNEALEWESDNGEYFPVTGGSDALVWAKMGWEDDRSGLTGDAKVNDRHPVFIRKAFEYASMYAEGKLELRDNSIEFPCRKARAFYQLVRHLQNSGAQIDAIGMQCHFDLEGPGMLDSAGLVSEIRKYRSIGVEVLLDEVDIGSKSGEWNTQLAEKQKQEYKRLMTIALREGVGQVHFWGLRDDDEWWREGESPLLFGQDNAPKPAYYGVQEALQGYIESGDIRHPVDLLAVRTGDPADNARRLYTINGRLLPVSCRYDRRFRIAASRSGLVVPALPMP